MLPSDTTCVTKNKSLGDRKYLNNCPTTVEQGNLTKNIYHENI